MGSKVLFHKPLSISLDQQKLIFCSVLSIAFFLLNIELLVRLRNVGLADLTLFSGRGGYSGWIFAQECLTYLSGVLVVFIVPGLPWISALYRKKISVLSLVTLSFYVTALLEVACLTVLKIVYRQPLTAGFVVGVLIVLYGLGLMMNIRVNRALFIEEAPIERRSCILIVISILLLFAFIWHFQDKVLWVTFDNNYSEKHVLSIPLGYQSDVHEQFGRIASLSRNLWPYWDLEYADKFGYIVFDPPVYHFLNNIVVTLFGESFGVLAISYLLLVLVNSYIVLKLIVIDNYKNNTFGVLCSLIILAFTYIYILLTHKSPYDTLTDMSGLMSFFMLLQFFYLFNRNNFMFLVSALAAFLTQYEAAYFTLSGLFFIYILILKRKMHLGIDMRMGAPNKEQILRLFQLYIMCILIYFVGIAIMGLATGDLGVYIEAICIEKFSRLDLLHVLKHLFPVGAKGWPEYSYLHSISFLMIFMSATLLTGICFFVPKRDSIAKVFSYIGSLFLLLILLSRYSRLNYVTPLIFISMVVSLRTFIEFRNKGVFY